MARSTEAASARGETLPFELRDSPIQGSGAFATRKIRKGTRIIEYTGEIITVAESDKRYDDESMDRHHTFLFSLDDGTVIDAKTGGNESRFINHSCDPNCEAIDVRGRIFVEAIRTIQAGEELAYDYAYERDGFEDAKWEKFYVCRCGAANCRGTILAPPKEKPVKKTAAAKKTKTTSGSKRKVTSKAKAKSKTKARSKTKAKSKTKASAKTRKTTRSRPVARRSGAKRSKRGGAKRSR